MQDRFRLQSKKAKTRKVSAKSKKQRQSQSMDNLVPAAIAQIPFKRQQLKRPCKIFSQLPQSQLLASQLNSEVLKQSDYSAKLVRQVTQRSVRM